MREKDEMKILVSLPVSPNPNKDGTWCLFLVPQGDSLSFGIHQPLALQPNVASHSFSRAAGNFVATSFCSSTIQCSSSSVALLASLMLSHAKTPTQKSNIQQLNSFVLCDHVYRVCICICTLMFPISMVTRRRPLVNTIMLKITSSLSGVLSRFPKVLVTSTIHINH